MDKRSEMLASSSASWEPWSWVFTALVVIGVLLEFWVIWHEHREDTETWALTFLGVDRTLRPSRNRLIAEYLSVALVSGGIIGELIVGVEIGLINSQLRRIDAQLRTKSGDLRSDSDQLVALVTQEAGDAKQSAIAAADGASAASASATKLRDEVEYEELILAARAANVDFEPSMFDKLSPKVLRIVWVSSICGEGNATALFAQKLVTVLRRRGWSIPAPAPCSTRGVFVPPGIMVYNRWVSMKRGVFGNPSEQTFFTLVQDLSDQHPELDRKLIENIAAVSLAFGANLDKKDIYPPVLGKDGIAFVIGRSWAQSQ
ncbi:hypothetical protein P8935_16195 [Telmatobacter sp. DSM 110680]|uniref:Uncharacterized protein n=1 Tax=Telmatobacter sp. DSM 110680 TaxID=3036704 RepID=A0AAU7DFH8_9BACT